YVVALLFVVFDVEVAFFFPWAEVFGKANALATLDDPGDDRAAWKDYSEKLDDLASPVAVPRTAGERALLVDLRDPDKLEQRLEAIKEARKKQAARKDMSEEEAMLLQSGDPDKHFQRTREQARGLAWLALIEVLVFFGVLLV